MVDPSGCCERFLEVLRTGTLPGAEADPAKKRERGTVDGRRIAPAVRLPAPRGGFSQNFFSDARRAESNPNCSNAACAEAAAA
jgi:hypothetical protein